MTATKLYGRKKAYSGEKGRDWSDCPLKTKPAPPLLATISILPGGQANNPAGIRQPQKPPPPAQAHQTIAKHPREGVSQAPGGRRRRAGGGAAGRGGRRVGQGAGRGGRRGIASRSPHGPRPPPDPGPVPPLPSLVPAPLGRPWGWRGGGCCCPPTTSPPASVAPNPSRGDKEDRHAAGPELWCGAKGRGQDRPTGASRKAMAGDKGWGAVFGGTRLAAGKEAAPIEGINDGGVPRRSQGPENTKPDRILDGPSMYKPLSCMLRPLDKATQQRFCFRSNGPIKKHRIT